MSVQGPASAPPLDPPSAAAPSVEPPDVPLSSTDPPLEPPFDPSLALPDPLLSEDPSSPPEEASACVAGGLLSFELPQAAAVTARTSRAASERARMSLLLSIIVRRRLRYGPRRSRMNAHQVHDVLGER